MNAREFVCQFVLAKASSQGVGIQDAVNQAPAFAERLKNYFTDDDNDIRDILKPAKGETVKERALLLVEKLQKAEAKVSKVAQEYEIQTANSEILTLKTELDKANARVAELQKQLENNQATSGHAVREGINQYRAQVLAKMEYLRAHTHNPDQLEGLQRAIEKV